MAGSAGPAAGTRDDLRLRVLELRRDPAGHLSETRFVEVPPQQVGDCRPSSEPVEVQVQLETVSDGVRTTGTVGFRWEGPCRRCLETAEGSGSSAFEELFVDDPDRWVPDEGAAAEEVHPIEQGWIDLSDVVRDSVLLGLPLAPLCRADCGGPDPDAFPVAVEEHPSAGVVDAQAGYAVAGDGEPPMDPRWAKLSEVTFDDE